MEKTIKKKVQIKGLIVEVPKGLPDFKAILQEAEIESGKNFPSDMRGILSELLKNTFLYGYHRALDDVFKEAFKDEGSIHKKPKKVKNVGK